jgi:hypothetical protein
MYNTNDLLIPYFFNALPTVDSAERHGVTVMMQTPHHGHSLLMESSTGQILNPPPTRTRARARAHTHTHTHTHTYAGYQIMMFHIDNSIKLE